MEREVIHAVGQRGCVQIRPVQRDRGQNDRAMTDVIHHVGHHGQPGEMGQRLLLRKAVGVGDRDIVGGHCRLPAEADMQVADGHLAADGGRSSRLHDRDEPVPVPQQDQGNYRDGQNAEDERGDAEAASWAGGCGGLLHDPANAQPRRRFACQRYDARAAGAKDAVLPACSLTSTCSSQTRPCVSRAM